MPSADAMTASLFPKLRHSIEAPAMSGRYQTANEMVRAGLRLLARMHLPRPIERPGGPVHEAPGEACPR